MADPITATIMIASAGLSIGSSLIGGAQQKKAAEEQAELMRDQGALARAESDREALRKGEERDKFIAQQKVSFLANGIGLGGSSLAVMEDTFNQFQQEIDAIRRAGTAQQDFTNRQARLTERSGRAALFGGVAQAASSAGGMFVAGKQSGAFAAKKTTQPGVG